MDWSFNAVGPIDVHVEVPAGRVDLRPHAEGSGPVLVALDPAHPGSRKAEAQIAASRVTFASGRLDVKVPSRPFARADICCTVDLPAGSSLTVTTASADVTVTGAVGECTVTTASGDLSLPEAAGCLRFTTASGDLRIERAGAGLKVKGASGDVRAGEVSGPIDIALASGDVALHSIGAGARVNTASGDIRVDRASEGELNLRSASGDITVGVAAGVGAYLDVKTVSGEMTCGLPADDAASGDARLRITCSTVSGDISIGPAG
ncbi:MAG TPA: DUF4097 family beta strand repeat-containing protein [Acidimicrobiales bacterium]|nr:DUF4097 family beta strand repeat-containing protein [Acidimicrobiales bacterium]